MNRQLGKLKKAGIIHDVEFLDEFRTETLPAFLNGLSVVSVPVLKGEAFGLYQLESMASGIPVVQPALGAFPEIAALTGGGYIYQPNTAKALSSALTELLSNPQKLLQMSKQGRKSVQEQFDSKILSEKMVKVYENVIQNTKKQQC